jgi:hypothetical protein
VRSLYRQSLTSSVVLEQGKEAWALLFENNGIPLFPKVPAAKLKEGGALFRSNQSGNCVRVLKGDIRVHGEAIAHSGP